MLWWLSSARSRRRVWLRLSARCLKSKTSSLIYLDNNMALSGAEALKMDRSALYGSVLRDGIKFLQKMQKSVETEDSAHESI